MSGAALRSHRDLCVAAARGFPPSKFVDPLSSGRRFRNGACTCLVSELRGDLFTTAWLIGTEKGVTLCGKSRR